MGPLPDLCEDVEKNECKYFPRKKEDEEVDRMEAEDG